MSKKNNLQYSAANQTLIGIKSKQLIDTETGETILVDQITKRAYGTKAFWKCYLCDFLAVLGILDSKQLDVFVYIVEHTNQSNNLFIGTYDDIAEGSTVSRPTVCRIMKKLQENNFIAKKMNGVYFVNPNILMKGNDHKRQILLSYYESEKAQNEVSITRAEMPPYKETDNPDVVIQKPAEELPPQPAAELPPRMTDSGRPMADRPLKKKKHKKNRHNYNNHNNNNNGGN